MKKRITKKNGLKTIRHCMGVVLREANEPLHIDEIVKRTEKLRGVQANKHIYWNVLSDNKEFMKVSKKMYAHNVLEDDPDKLVNAIKDILKKHNAVSSEHIIVLLKDKLYVQDTAVILTLGKRDFHKDEQGLYRIREIDGSVRDTFVETIPN